MATSTTEPKPVRHDAPADERASADRPPERRSSDRRQRPTSFLSRYALFGGRRKGDRRGGATANTYVDVYSARLAVVLVTIGLLCALDAVYTLLYLDQGGEEANPIMEHVIGWGPRAFILVKCGVTNLGLAVLCLHKNFAWVRAVIVGLLVAYVALFGYHLYLAAHVRG